MRRVAVAALRRAAVVAVALLALGGAVAGARVLDLPGAAKLEAPGLDELVGERARSNADIENALDALRDGTLADLDGDDVVGHFNPFADAGPAAEIARIRRDVAFAVRADWDAQRSNATPDEVRRQLGAAYSSASSPQLIREMLEGLRLPLEDRCLCFDEAQVAIDAWEGVRTDGAVAAAAQLVGRERYKVPGHDDRWRQRPVRARVLLVREAGRWRIEARYGDAKL